MADSVMRRLSQSGTLRKMSSFGKNSAEIAKMATKPKVSGGMQSSFHHKMAKSFYQLGLFVGRHPYKTIIITYLVLVVFAVGLTQIQTEYRLQKLWIDSNSKIKPEEHFVNTVFGGLGLLELITLSNSNSSSNNNAATAETFLVELDLFKRINGYTFEHPDVVWGAGIPADDKWGVFKWNATNSGIVNLPDPANIIGRDICEEASIPLPAYTQFFDLFGENFWPGQYNASTDFFVMYELMPTVLRFPCILTRPIDCFQEGGFDYQYPLPTLQFIGACPNAGLAPCPGVTKDEIYVWVWFMSAMMVTPNPYLPQPYYDYFAAILTGVLGTPQTPITARPSVATASDELIAKTLSGGCIPFSAIQDPENSILGGVVPPPGAGRDVATDTNLITSTKAHRLTYNVNNAFQQAEKFQTQIVYESYNIHSAKHPPLVIGQPMSKGLQKEYAKFQLGWENVFIHAMLGQEDFATAGSLITEYYNVNFPNTIVEFMCGRSADDVVAQAGGASVDLIIGSYVIMFAFATATMVRFNVVQSRMFLGFAGIVQVAFSVVASLGLAGWAKSPLNPISTQILPFLALGLGTADMFVIMHEFPNVAKTDKVEKVMAETLRSVGASVTTCSLSNLVAFALAITIPIPAVQAFAIQIVFVIITTWFVNLFCFSALCVLTARRQQEDRVDILCCITAPLAGQEVSTKERSFLDNWARDVYGTFLMSKVGKILTILISIMLIVLGVIGALNDSKGLTLQEAAPKGYVQNFLVVNDKYFGTYPASVFFKDFDHSTHQADIVGATESLQKVPYAVNGATNLKTVSYLFSIYENVGVLHNFICSPQLPDFAYAAAVAATPDDATTLCNRNYPPNTGVPVMVYADFPLEWKGALAAYNLTNAAVANSCNPSVLQLVAVVPPEAGWMLPPAHFDDYTLVYVQTIGSSYYSSIFFQPVKQSPCLLRGGQQCALPCELLHVTSSEATVVWQGVKVNSDYVAVIKESRAAVREFGLNVAKDGGHATIFPYGLIHLYWEQYVSITKNTFTAVGLALLGVFCVTYLVALNLRVSFLLVTILLILDVEIYGFIYWLGLHVSAVPVVNIIMTTGICVEFTVYFVIAFLSATGGQEARVIQSLHQLFVPIFFGAVATFLSIVLLSATSFRFMVDYYFKMFSILILFGAFNGLAFLPVMLAFVGPDDPQWRTALTEDVYDEESDNNNNNNNGGDMKMFRPTNSSSNMDASGSKSGGNDVLDSPQSRTRKVSPSDIIPIESVEIK